MAEVRSEGKDLAPVGRTAGIDQTSCVDEVVPHPLRVHPLIPPDRIHHPSERPPPAAAAAILLRREAHHRDPGAGMRRGAAGIFGDGGDAPPAEGVGAAEDGGGSMEGGEGEERKGEEEPEAAVGSPGFGPPEWWPRSHPRLGASSSGGGAGIWGIWRFIIGLI